MKKGLSVLIRVVVSFGLLGGLFWVMRGQIGDISRTIFSSNPAYLMASVLFLLVMVALLSARLKVVFEGEDLALSFRESAELTCVGFFFNNFMPTAVGGDIVKAHYASRFNSKKIKSYASVFMDRIIGMLAILFIAVVAVVFDRGRFSLAVIRPMIFIFLVIGMTGIVVVTNRTVARLMERFFTRFRMMGLGERLNEAYSIIHDYRNRPDVVVRSLLYSVLVQASNCILVYFLFVSLGKPVSLGNIFLLMPVVVFISMVPSIGGLGVREYAMVAFFSVVAGREVSFAVSLLVLAGNFLVSIAGGLVYMRWTVAPSRALGKTEV